jgi:putative ABC transport system substrate-binding protein
MQLAPEVILAVRDQVAQVAKLASQTIPVVFIGTSDQIAEGFVQSLAHPNGNMTGFTVQEPSLGPKWISLLKEVAPQLTRIAVFSILKIRGPSLCSARVSMPRPS